jgi:hypothetical protein
LPRSIWAVIGRERVQGTSGGQRRSSPEQAPKESPRDSLRLLQLAAFFSSFDRFAVAPMLVTIAASLGTSLAGVAATASLYYLLYGGLFAAVIPAARVYVGEGR